MGLNCEEQWGKTCCERKTGKTVYAGLEEKDVAEQFNSIGTYGEHKNNIS